MRCICAERPGKVPGRQGLRLSGPAAGGAPPRPHRPDLPLFSRFRCSISSWSLASVSECCCCRNCRLFSRSRTRFCVSLSPRCAPCGPGCWRTAGGRWRERNAPRRPEVPELEGRCPVATPTMLMEPLPPSLLPPPQVHSVARLPWPEPRRQGNGRDPGGGARIVRSWAPEGRGVRVGAGPGALFCLGECSLT